VSTLTISSSAAPAAASVASPPPDSELTRDIAAVLKAHADGGPVPSISDQTLNENPGQALSALRPSFRAESAKVGHFALRPAAIPKRWCGSTLRNTCSHFARKTSPTPLAPPSPMRARAKRAAQLAVPYQRPT